MKSIRNAGRLQQPGGGLRVNSLSVLSCVVLMTLGSCASPYDGTPKTLGLVPVLPTRFPVVALTAGQPALIQSTGRQGDDASNPVHQFGSLFDLNLNVLGAPQDFAANTSTTLLASGRPDLSGSNDSLVADASGQGTALWFASNASGKYEVYASRYLTNSGWVAKDLLATSSFSVVDHRVAMNGIGGALAMWSLTDGSIHGREYSNRDGWLADAAIPLPPGATSGRLHGVAFTDDPYGYAIWTHVDEMGNTPLHVSRYAGGEWSFDSEVIGNVPGLESARIALHPDASPNRPAVVWKGSDGVYFNKRYEDGNWFSIAGEKISGAGLASDVQIVMSASGDCAVVWVESGSGVVVRRLVAGIWQPAETVTGPDLGGGHPQIAGDSAGNLVVVWTSGNGVGVNRFSVDDGWRGPQVFESKVVTQTAAYVAMDDSGRALAVWEAEKAGGTGPASTYIETRVISDNPVASFTSTPENPQTGQEVTFDASASYGGSNIVEYSWDFDADGVEDATGVVATYTFAIPSTPYVHLTVVDENGFTGTATAVLLVTDANGNPPSGPKLSITVEPVDMAAIVGQVYSSTGGISCGYTGTRCSEYFTAGTHVTLTSIARTAGWNFETFVCPGGADQAGARTLQLVMTRDIQCTARFANDIERMAVNFVTDANVAPDAAYGNVSSTSSNGVRRLDCTADCDRPFTHGQTVELRGTGYTTFFVGWDGCDSIQADPLGGTQPLCRVGMDRQRNVTAFFRGTNIGGGPNMLGISFPIDSAAGSVRDAANSTAAPCTPQGGTCDLGYDFIADVVLLVEPSGSNSLASYQGCDTFIPASGSATAECHLTMNRHRGVVFGFTAINAPPVAVITRTPSGPVAASEVIHFSGLGSYDDQDPLPLQYDWDFDGDGTTDDNAAEPTTFYTVAGTYVVTLRVTDVQGATSTASTTVEVTSDNAPPVAAFTFSPTTPSIGAVVTFDASASTDDSAIARYRWDFGNDGSFEVIGDPATARTTLYTFGAVGTFEVRLSVVDDAGFVNEVIHPITVTSAGSGDNVTLTLTLTGSGHGVVEYAPSATACSKDSEPVCVRLFPNSSTVTLTATAYGGSTLGNWGTGCQTITEMGTVCTIFMDGNRTMILPIN